MKPRALAAKLCAGLGLFVVFWLSALFALAVHSNLPRERRMLSQIIARALEQNLAGRFEIGAVERIGPSGISLAGVIVRDPSGRVVLTLSRLSVEASWFAFARSLVFAGPKPTRVVDAVHVEEAEVQLFDDNASGRPSIVDAFTARAATNAASPDAKGGQARFALKRFDLTRGYARGSVAGLPTLEAEVSHVRGYLLVTSRRSELALERFSVSARGVGGADLRGVSSLKLQAPGWVWASFDGYFGDVQVGSVVRVEGDRIALTADLPRASAAGVRGILPGYPLVGDVAGHFEFGGKLPQLTANARLSAGNAELFAIGALRLGADPEVALEVSAKHLDARLVSARAPHTDVDVSSTLALKTLKTNPTLELEGLSSSFVLAEATLPAAEFRLRLNKGLLNGEALLKEPGSPVRASYRLDAKGVLDVHAQTDRLPLARLERLTHVPLGQGDSRLELDAHVDGSKLSLSFAADVHDYRRDRLSFERAALSGKANGPLQNPSALDVEAKVHADKVRVGEFEIAALVGRVRGRLGNPEIDVSVTNPDGATLTGKARVKPFEPVKSIQNLTLSYRKDETTLDATLAELALGEDSLELKDLDLKGLGGTLKGSLEFRPSLFSLEADGKNIDLRAFARVLGYPSHYAAGTLDVSADVLLARDIERAALDATLRDGTVGPLTGVGASVEARLENKRLSGELDSTVKDLGRGAARFDISLPGSVREKNTLRDALGELDIDLSEIDLGLLGQTLAPGKSAAIRGNFAVALKATRSVPYALPSLAASGYTSGLSVAAGVLAASLPAFDGIDVRFGANASGETGESDVSLKLVDRRGVLASASLAGTIDLLQAVKSPSRILEQLLETPIAGKLLTDERRLSDWPAGLVPFDVDGVLRAEAALSGTLAKPVVSGRARLKSFELFAASGDPPLDLCTTFVWESSSARVGSNGELFLSSPARAPCEGRRVAQYSLNGVLPNARSPHFNAEATLSVERLPLEAVPGLGDADLGGFATGRASLTTSERAPELSASFSLEKTRMHELPLGDGKLELRSNENTLGGSLHLARGESTLDAQLLAALDTRGAVPELASEQSIGLRLQAHAADAVVLTPVVRDVLTEIGGKLDADLSLSLLLPHAGSALGGKVNGSLALHAGSLALAGLGLRLNDVELAARAEPDGNQTRVDVSQLRGQAGQKQRIVTLRDGKIWLNGLDIARAQGNLSASELPLVLEGVPQATLSTRQNIAFDLEHQKTAMAVRLRVPSLSVALPQSASRNLISLDENRSIQIVQPLGETRQSAGNGLPWILTFEFGDNVKLTRADLDLPLTGRAQVTLGEAVSVEGDLDLISGGRIDVSGKTFVIESGEVHFDTGDPANPRIRVTANYRASDGSIITAEVSGTLKQATLALSSPGRSLQEIYALLLGGSGNTNEGGDARATGAGVGADQLLGPLLANTPLHRIEIRTGSEQSADQRSYSTYSAAVPIGENVWFEGSYKTLTSSDTNAQGNAVSGTVDWRFRRNWSLRTEIGTIGTGVDLLWNYRY